MNLNFVYTREYDVVVCGLGSAGFTAAVMCGRLGMKTAAVEKYNMPGGVMTVLGNNSIDQFNNPFIPGDNLVIKGIGWEFVNRLAKSGQCRDPRHERRISRALAVRSESQSMRRVSHDESHDLRKRR